MKIAGYLQDRYRISACRAAANACIAQPRCTTRKRAARKCIVDGRKIRLLTIVDTYKRECIALEAAYGFKSADVIRVLRRITAKRGKPTNNAFVESFNGRVRQELLNPSWFYTIEDAQREARIWRQDYNEIRPHRSLGNKSPKEFVLARERELQDE
jgi:putative transposase